MPTITDTLAQLGQDLRAAITSVLGLEGRIQQKFDANTNNVTTIINNFLGRPAVQTVWCDPVDGIDGNDGSAPDKARKTLDAIVEGMGTTVTRVYLLGDTTFRRRNNLNASLEVIGAQRINAAPFFTVINRKISFLANAENSPAVGVGNFASGLWLYCNSFNTLAIDFDLPEVPIGYDYRSHFSSTAGTTFKLANGTVTVRGSNAAALISARGGRSTVVASGLTLGTGAAGHLLEGITAGANPNNDFSYVSNLTAA